MRNISIVPLEIIISSFGIFSPTLIMESLE